ncbi:MAG: hypothetical protein MUF51_04855 [Vicinamibacteria bacterium]|jgi:hypothetical protein|nr:hypothetical protein [Vicinamibacteria bacterium]
MASYYPSLIRRRSTGLPHWSVADPTQIVHIDPGDGACGVFRDAPVVLRLSRPLDPRSVSSESIRIEDEAGAVPGRALLNPDGLVVVWQAERLLRPAGEHVILIRGLLDALGQAVIPHVSCFFPCDLTSCELLQMNDHDPRGVDPLSAV